MRRPLHRQGPALQGQPVCCHLLRGKSPQSVPYHARLGRYLDAVPYFSGMKRVRVLFDLGENGAVSLVTCYNGQAFNTRKTYLSAPYRPNLCRGERSAVLGLAEKE